MGVSTQRKVSLYRLVTLAALAAVVLSFAQPVRAVDPLPPNLSALRIETDEGFVPALADPESGIVNFMPRGNGNPAVPPPFQHVRIDGQGGNAPTLEFTSGEPYRLQVELFFDGYEEKTDVREYTDKIEKLAMVNPEKHRPPTCLINWGAGLVFKCVLESFTLRFTLFLDDGTPVRAVMNCTFKEYAPAQDQLKGNPRH